MSFVHCIEGINSKIVFKYREIGIWDILEDDIVCGCENYMSEGKIR